ETHEFDFAGFDALDELGNFLDRANLHEHAENFFVGAAVEGTVESGNGGGSGGIRIDVRAANTSNRIGGTVLLVVGMQDEKHVERMLQSRIRAVFRFGGAKEHIEEIAGVPEFVVRINERHA